MSILDELNVDIETFTWADLATCQYLPDEVEPRRFFFEDFLASEEVRNIVTEMCDTCPVREACLEYGVSHKSQGVWGGVYLEDGRAK